MRILLIMASIVFALTACNEAGKEKEDPNKTDTLVLQNGIDLQPQMKNTDSVQALFFKDPDGDPERYTRFYAHFSTTDSGFIKPLLRGLNQPFQEFEQTKYCRSEGKIYLFKKGTDDPLQTIYFSTRCDTCCYVYYIRNGRFYYMNMNDELSGLLKGSNNWFKQYK